MLIAVVDAEHALVGAFNLVEPAAAFLRKLVGRFLGVLDGLVHHLGLDVLERGEFIHDGVVVRLHYGDSASIGLGVNLTVLYNNISIGTLEFSKNIFFLISSHIIPKFEK